MGYGLLEVRRKGMVSLTAFTAVSGCLSAGASITAEAADNNMDYRRKVVGITGIMSNATTGLTDSVTRGEFSQMLVKASEYRDYLPSASSVSVYSDVAAGSDYAPSIRIAAEQGWIVGYLGGNVPAGSTNYFEGGRSWDIRAFGIYQRRLYRKYRFCPYVPVLFPGVK